MHVIDASDPAFEAQVEAVERILGSLELSAKPRLKVWNKADRMTPDAIEALLREHGGVTISAARREGLAVLLEKAERTLFAESGEEGLKMLAAAEAT